ncbi:SDR family NAD(P)-dependent oxidoreductase [Vibrio sp. Vb339]|uniref:SDR family NAD(P)-dependent oxidoreductase n=1 Tax=Vibrio sp. Vb339 TaxID=1192013 RepID=UPI001553661C|nr:SDR family NAD(P)-dependent oxidoreductase [Vibrio sp. Vb339]
MKKIDVILVTGGTHGIGAAVVKRLAEEDITVIFSGRDEKAGLAIQDSVDRTIFIKADMSSEEDIIELVNRSCLVGNLVGLVNNAGTSSRTPFLETSTEEWDRVFSINTRASFYTIKCALPYLQQTQGAVVNMASIAGKVGEEGLAAYTSSKAAVIGLTQALALEFGDKVRFNAVCPGQIQTRMMDKVINNKPHLEALTHRIPMGRLGQANEIANVVKWLLSSEASFVNGATLSADGGESSGYRTPKYS